MNRHLASLAGAVAFAGLLAGGTPVIAQGGSSREPRAQTRLEADPNLAKVSAQLLAARRMGREGRSAAEVRRAMPRLPIKDGLVAVEIRLRDPNVATESLLEAAGLTARRSYPRYAAVTGRIDPEQLGELAAVAEVVSVRPLFPPRRRAGNVTSQGDASIRADAARTQFGVDGTGVTVGVISDSFSQLLATGSSGASVCQPTNPDASILTGSTPQTQGELPASVEILDNCSSPTNCSAPLDEGRALAEIIHDLAPGAEILFRSGYSGEVDFAAGIADLQACGADVIVDDLIYEREPMFQDGDIAQAAQAAVDAGVAFFSTAGNEAGVGLDEMYVDDVPATDDPTGLSGEDFHDFGGDDPYAAINLAWNCGITLVLQWNEPFESLGGSGASTDLNLALCTGETPETCSYDVPGPPDRQGCGSGGGTVPKGDAVETTSYFNFSPTADRETVYVAVDRFCSRAGGPLPSDVRFRVVAFGDGCSLGDSEVAADCSTSTRSFCFEAGIFDTFQIYGHAAAEGVVAVGASFYEEIDSGGTVDPPTTQIDVEPFSSLGGDLPFYFTGSGSPLPGAPVTRFKPDVAAPDVVNTSFFGAEDPDPGGSFEGDGFPNFVGTSAAAPHAAAVAALMLDAEPNLTGSGIGKLLTCRARDIESAGPDPLSGFGLVDAVEALAALQPQITLATSAELTNNVGDPTSLDEGDVLTYGYDVTNPNPFPLASVSVTDPHPGLSAITCPGGNPVPQLAENGAAASCTATYTVTAGDVSSGSISNTATATGLACGAASVTGQAMDGMTIPTCILDRVLPETVETGTGVEKTACRTLDSGTSYVIQVGAEVAFRAGGTIILRNGFTVDGTFAAVLDPDLDI